MASLLGFVLLTAMGVLLVLMLTQSFWTGGKLGWESRQIRDGRWERRDTDVLWGNGTVGLVLVCRRFSNPHEWLPKHAYSRLDIDYVGHGNYGAPGPWSWLNGFGVQGGELTDSRQTIHGYEVWTPIWLPLLLAWAWPALRAALFFARWVLRRRRLAAGHCSKCGYNLRASQSATCPECGASRSTTTGTRVMSDA